MARVAEGRADWRAIVSTNRNPQEHAPPLPPENHVQPRSYYLAHETPESLFQALDPGIRYEVEVLRNGGIETYESCQGGEGHAYPEPTVAFRGGPGEGARAYAISRDFGLPVSEVRRGWHVLDGELVGPHWEIVFRHEPATPPACAAPRAEERGEPHV